MACMLSQVGSEGYLNSRVLRLLLLLRETDALACVGRSEPLAWTETGRRHQGRKAGRLSRSGSGFCCRSWCLVVGDVGLEVVELGCSLGRFASGCCLEMHVST